MIAAADRPPENARAVGWNLLTVPAFRAVVLGRGFPYLLQVATLAALVSLAWLGRESHPPGGVPDKLYAKANLVTLVVWGLFWPSIVWATVLLGRVWCTVCPLELVSNLSERLGRRLGITQGVLPPWLRAGWLTILLYAALQLMVAGLHLHRMPAYTTIFLGGMLATAAITGLLLKDRAYCRGFCPVAPLLALYGRGGMLAVRAGESTACGDCLGKSCSSSGLRVLSDARSCPTLLNPAQLESSEDCLLCGQCLKNCASGNMRILMRAPYSHHDRRPPLASWPMVLFVMLLSGFVTSEVASEWAVAKKLFLAPANWTAAALRLEGIAGWVEGVWTLAVFPVALWLLLAGAVKVLRGANSVGEAARRIALPVAVVLAAGHMAKGLAKFSTWVGFLPIALQTPGGESTSLAMAAKALKEPAALLPMGLVSLLGLCLVTAAVWIAQRELRLANGRFQAAWGVPLTVVGVLFGVVILRWGFLS